MTRVVATALLILVSIHLSVLPPTVAGAEEQQLAPEGRGLLPKTTGTTPQEQSNLPHVFRADPSGSLSRTIFETDEDPNFRLIIREFSFPPDRQPYSLTLPFGALVHLPIGTAEISVGKKRLETPEARTAVPAGVPIEIFNYGEYPVVLRAIIVEAK